MAIRVMLAAVATDEPQIAPKAPEAAMEATASPPRRPDRTTRAALKSSADMRDPEATSPIRTKSGITERL